MSTPKHGYRRLLRRVLEAEGGLRGYRPTVRRAVEKPPDADRILAAIAAAYPVGTAVSTREILAASGCTHAAASATRAWARAAGLWPWPKPGLCRPAGKTDPGPRRRRERAR
jgi:hypothetical protein